MSATSAADKNVEAKVGEGILAARSNESEASIDLVRRRLMGE